MSTMSYISVIERYNEYRAAIHSLLGSILTGIVEEPLFYDKQTQCKAMKCLGERYPFVEILYILNANGVQVGDNVAVSTKHPAAYSGKGKDRSQRPYFMLARNESGVVITEPYLSTASRKLAISAALKGSNGEKTEYLVLDVDLTAIIEFLMGDALRRRFQPMFKTVYSIFVIGLFLVVAALLTTAFREMATFIISDSESKVHNLKPFGVIIFLTLGLAIFDLGKTTLEEEVLMHKDIFRHSSTRRTITRFIAAILIAVSIESLLLMFKAALGESDQLIKAVWMMLASVGLLVGLGIYVYLGAKAEVNLTTHKR